jgi:extracellular factor (EF) 3-hydroxypalmitic acid methyl ester biosynthesis protein
MPVLPLWRADHKKCLDVVEIDRIVNGAALELASSLESIKVTTRQWEDSKLATALIRLAVDECLGKLAKTGLWGPENRLPSNQFWKIVGSYLQCGWLQQRAREKPLGYAGDHELLARICAQQCTDDPLGVCFDQYFLAQAAPEAVRQRTALAARQLASSALAHPDGLRVVGVGCGPALEFEQGLKLLPAQSPIEVTLLDLCGEALATAEKRLSGLLPRKNLNTLRENLPRLPQRDDAQKRLGNPHLLLCPGLFDYLETPAAIALLRLFWQQLAPEGMLLVGNFAPNHATRAYMEWIGNWYLIYRSFEEMLDLADHAGIPANCLQIGTETTGSDWFLVARKA